MDEELIVSTGQLLRSYSHRAEDLVRSCSYALGAGEKKGDDVQGTSFIRKA